jgi:hypothetical protein
MDFIKTVKEVLQEGEGLEGFDLPPRYPFNYKNVIKRVILADTTKKNTWYIETKPLASNNWAIYRAAAAQLKREGTSQENISKKIHSYLRNVTPYIKTITSDMIPDNEKNIIFLKH